MEQEKEYRINNSTIKIIFGNLLDSQAEVIVSSDDGYITMGGGVSMAIKRKEGTGAIMLDAKKKEKNDTSLVIMKNMLYICTLEPKL